MDSNELSELRELVEFLKASEIAEFKWTRGDVHLELKFQSAMPAPGVDMARLAQIMAHAPAAGVVAAPPAPAHAHETPAPAAPAATAEAPNHIVKSPIVGTFYESPAPGSPAFVKVGDVVEVGQVLCIVEAMKLMNEIESDAAGEVVERIAQSGQPVEYGQALFAIKAK